MTWFIATPAGRYILAGVAAALLVTGGIAYVYHKGENAGHADDAQITSKKQGKIDDAEAHGPRTPDDVDQRLRDGKF